jgi:hypothetical protein
MAILKHFPLKMAETSNKLFLYTYYTMVIPLQLQTIPQPSLEPCFGHSPCFSSPDIITMIYLSQ